MRQSSASASRAFGSSLSESVAERMRLQRVVANTPGVVGALASAWRLTTEQRDGFLLTKQAQKPAIRGSAGCQSVIRGSLPRIVYHATGGGLSGSLRDERTTFGRRPNATGWQPVFPGTEQHRRHFCLFPIESATAKIKSEPACCISLEPYGGNP